MSLISTHNLTLVLDGQTVLKNVNIAINRGEIVTIVGPNGSGKSSLLRALIGALKPASGTVTRAEGLRIGYVPQKLQIDATLPLTVHGFLNLPNRQPRAVVEDALKKAGVGDVRRDMGCAVLMVSHDLHVVMAASDRVVCLNGHVCCEGTPEIVADAPEYRALFGTGTQGAFALYRHEHTHSHDHDHDHTHCDGDH